MSKIFVNYIIQNDSWESINEPNLYVLPGTYKNLNDVTAKLIYDTFPIKTQRFYLRFFLDDKLNGLKVWMDYPPSATIPVYTDKVFVKALRLPKIADSIKHKAEDVFKKTEEKEKPKKKENTDVFDGLFGGSEQNTVTKPLSSDKNNISKVVDNISANLIDHPSEKKSKTKEDFIEFDFSDKKNQKENITENTEKKEYGGDFDDFEFDKTEKLNTKTNKKTNEYDDIDFLGSKTESKPKPQQKEKEKTVKKDEEDYTTFFNEVNSSQKNSENKNNTKNEAKKSSSNFF